MSTFNIIVSLLIADILSVSMFVLLDWKPVDVWDRAKVLTRNIIKAIIPIVKSIPVSNNHKDGAEIFNQMCREHDEFSERFNSLVKEYRDTKP